MLHKITRTESKDKFKKKEVVGKGEPVFSTSVINSSNTNKNQYFICAFHGENSSVISNWSIVNQKSELSTAEAVNYILKSMDSYQKKWERFFEQEAENEKDLFDLDNEK